MKKHGYGLTLRTMGKYGLLAGEGATVPFYDPWRAPRYCWQICDAVGATHSWLHGLGVVSFELQVLSHDAVLIVPNSPICLRAPLPCRISSANRSFPAGSIFRISVVAKWKPEFVLSVPSYVASHTELLFNTLTKQFLRLALASLPCHRIIKLILNCTISLNH